MQLQKQNPQMYQLLNQAKQNNVNPNDLFRQLTQNYTPQQMQNLFSNAQQMGFPNEILQQLQNLK